jgi:hypothetical protein
MVDVTAYAPPAMHFGGVSLVDQGSDEHQIEAIPPPLVLIAADKQRTQEPTDHDKLRPPRNRAASISAGLREPPPKHLHELDRIRMVRRFAFSCGC